MAPALCPRFLGGDVTAQLFVAEDLGEGRTLEDLLIASDEKAASDAVVTLAAGAGRLHAATLDHCAEFDRLREALAPRDGRPMARAAAVLRAPPAGVTRWLTAVGIRVPRGLAESLAALADAVEEPGPLYHLHPRRRCAQQQPRFAGRPSPSRLRVRRCALRALRHAVLESLLPASCDG